MKINKYISLSLVGLAMASCSDSFLEEKMVATITQDYFNTEKGFAELITGTYDALRQSKQYEQGPYVYFSGVDNMSLHGSNGIYSASYWTSSGKIASLVLNKRLDYTLVLLP